VATLAISVALAVTGCVATPGGTKPTPSPSATPLFHSDEEALAAAEEAYAAYQRVSDQILVEGGANPERLRVVATEDQFAYEAPGFAEAYSKGYRSSGGSKFDSMTIQELDNGTSPGSTVMSVYVCDDYSAVDIVDANGTSIVPPERPDRFPRVVRFDASGNAKNPIVVGAIDEWTGDTFC
jgi:hypothetical protein